MKINYSEQTTTKLNHILAAKKALAAFTSTPQKEVVADIEIIEYILKVRKELA